MSRRVLQKLQSMWSAGSGSSACKRGDVLMFKTMNHLRSDDIVIGLRSQQLDSAMAETESTQGLPERIVVSLESHDLKTMLEAYTLVIGVRVIGRRAVPLFSVLRGACDAFLSVLIHWASSLCSCCVRTCGSCRGFCSCGHASGAGGGQESADSGLYALA